MRKILLMTLIGYALIGCQKKDDPLNYFTSSERDSLLADIITYVYNRPTEATTRTRFDSKHRKYYVAQINKFKLEKYWVNEGEVQFYYIIRPAISAEGNLRGVGGLFKRDVSGKIISFKEIFNTPVLAMPELRQRGGEMFHIMVRDGNVNGYLKNPDYVEWPNKYLRYDTVLYQWIPVN